MGVGSYIVNFIKQEIWHLLNITDAIHHCVLEVNPAKSAHFIKLIKK